MTRLILVRHGETEWNRVERFRGRADVQLNERGLLQAEATSFGVNSRTAAGAVYSSPLSRAMRTAQAIAGRQSLRVKAHPGLVDIDYGAWQGLSSEEVRERWPEQLAAWYETPHLAEIPGGESLEDVRARCASAVREIAERHSGESVVLVAHSVVNRIILLCALGLDNSRFWHLRLDTCALNEIEANGEDFTVVSMNETCHLRTSSGPNDDIA